MFSWAICTLLSVIMIFFSVYFLFNSRKTKLECTFLFLMCAGFFAYLPHYLDKYAAVNAVICDIVNLYQIVTLNSNSYETIQPEVSDYLLFNTVLAVRACVHLFSPILGVTALYRFIKVQYEKIKSEFVILNKNKIYIFSAYNSKAEKIASDIARKHEKKSTIIFYETDKINADLEQKLGFNKISHISKKMKLDVKSKKLVKINSRKSEVYFFLINDGDENTELGLRLEKYYCNLAESSNKIEKNNIHIIVFSDYASTDEKLIDSIETRLDLRVIYPERLHAYKLLTSKPLFENSGPDDSKLSVLLIGYNGLSRELLSAALGCGQLVNKTIEFNILTENKEKAEKNLDFYSPELLHSGYSINFYETEFDSADFLDVIRKHCMDTTYTAVCGDSDISNIQIAIELRKFFLTEDDNFTNMPVIAVRIKDDDRAKILLGDNKTISTSDYNLFPFGYDRLIYNYEEMADSELEGLAKRVHFVYCWADTAEDAKESLNSYYKWERDRKSNLAMALSIKYKLWDMGFSVSEYNGKGTPDNSEFEQYINELTREKESSEKPESTMLYALDNAEHERWMVYQRSEGVRSMSLKQAENIMRNNPALLEQKINKEDGAFYPRSGKSITMMLHMDICKFEEITPRTAQINDILSDHTAHLPKNDTTFYDELIIRSLNKIMTAPQFIEVSGGKKYKIEKNDGILEKNRNHQYC